MSLSDALRALARDGRPLDWDAWYPLAQAAASDPQALIEAVGGLGEEDQYALLDHLKTDAGPLADYLLVTLAAHPAVFSDEQVTVYALADSAEALARRRNSLAQLAESLTTGIQTLDERRAAGFDAAAAIAELETRRNALRAEQIESGHRELSELEWEIDRLEILRARLGDYDPVERRARREELAVETTRLREERVDVENEVAEGLRQRDESQTVVDELQTRLGAVTAERSALEAQQAELAAQVADASAAIDGLRADGIRAAEQSAALLEEHARLEQNLRAEEARLEQLRASPLDEAAQRLRDEIRSLYAQLPDDDADPMFRSAGRSAGRRPRS